MNIIYFKDLKLEDVILISKAEIKATKFKFIQDKANTCFVFPNEIITHQYFQSDTTNKELIKANLKNDFAFIDPDLSKEIDVYETNLKNEYLLISNDNLKLIKNKLKHTGENISVTSECLLFKYLFEDNIEFNQSFFIEDTGTFVKLPSKLSIFLKKRKIKKLTVSDINITQDINDISYEINLINIQNILGGLLKKKFILALITVFSIINIIGLTNLFHKSFQINNLNTSAQNLYSNFFPNESFISMQASVIDRDIDLLVHKQPSEIVFKIFANVNDNIIINSLIVDSTSKLIKLNCSFINDIERANFINALTRAGINLNQVDISILNDLEQFKYEYKYE
ncbi:hypothetical protein M9B39_02695 [SAR86 cluster bacterium]|nr:hypothetical protein M9B39_02695 [SAR86 cluster bacterium]